MIYSRDQITGNSDAGLIYQGLFRRVRLDQADISSLLDAVASAQRIFLSKSDIHWELCEHVVGTLRLLLVPARDLLEATTRLPDNFDCSPLVGALYEVIKLLEDLALTIAGYPLANQASSSPTIAQRWDIQCKFDQLLAGCHTILRQANRLVHGNRNPSVV